MANSRQVLEKMREWVLAEIERAKKPYADKFQLTSLPYCAEKAAGPGPATEEALELLRSVAKAEPQHGTFSVVRPYGAIFLLDRALTQC